MTIEEKAKAYDEAIKRAKEINNEQRAQPFDVMTRVFFELKENENEKIRKGIKSILKHYKECGASVCPYPFVSIDEALAWLEKQKEPELSEDLGDYIAELSKQFPEVSFAKLSRIAVRVKKWLEKQGEQKPRYSIGDVLCDKSCTTLNKDTQPNFEIIDIRNGMYICDKGSFPISQQDEYELVAKKIDHKTTDKVVPKFQNGQWIVWQNKCYKVNDNGCGYELIDQNGLSTSLEYGTVDTSARLWDITKDAKKGDVLRHNGCTFIFICIEKGVVKGFEKYLCNGTKTCNFGKPNKDNDYCPATKEQRNTLIKAMADAGYTFDFEKKELKKIEQNDVEIPFGVKDSDLQEAVYYIPEGFHAEIKGNEVFIRKGELKPAWSEEDVKKIDRAIWLIEHDASHGWIRELREDVISGLKSLKQKIKL